LESSNYIIRIIKLIRINGREERCVQVYGENSGQFEDLDVNADIIKMDLKYQVWEDVDWINLA